MNRAEDEDFEVSPGWYAIREFRKISDGNTSASGTFHEGVVSTSHGFVWVYSEEGLSNYQVILDGRHHTRSEERSRTNEELARAARKFVKDLAARK